MIVRSALLARKLLNPLFFRAAGGESRPVFFDAEETYPALLEIDRNYEAIRTELLELLPKQENLQKYHEIDDFQQGISGNSDSNWRVFFLYGMGHELPNRELCPRTLEILEGIPGLFQAFFSILEPRKSIPAHNGPYLGYLRYHTAFKVPAENPPSIRIKDTVYTWKEGESVLFDDSWNHEVMNDSDDTRVVLIVDVLRPMPWLPHRLNRLASSLLFRRVFSKHVAGKIKDL